MQKTIPDEVKTLSPEKVLEQIVEINKAYYGETEYTASDKTFDEISSMGGITRKAALKYNFDEDIELIPLFDAHIGLRAHTKEQLIETVQYILAKPNRYTIIGGDFLECATKTSVGMAMYEEEMSPKMQLFYAYELLKPLADAGKILDVLTGNHEMRLANFADFNPLEILARQLKVPYSGFQGYVLLTVKDQLYKLAYFHGRSSSATPAGVMNAMRKQAGVAEADIYLSGHIHVKEKSSDPFYRINEKTGELYMAQKRYVVCGSFVDYWGGYAEMQSLVPAKTGTVKILFKGDKWSIDTYIPED